jgi:hypothetical protein
MPPLTVRAIRATPVEIPLNFVLGTSQAVIRQAPLLLIDLETEEGVIGRSYLFCYLAAAAPAIMSVLGEIERVVKSDRVDPAALWAKLARRFALACRASCAWRSPASMSPAGTRPRLLRASRWCAFSAPSRSLFPPITVAALV